ncbi:MAG: serine/threonine protein kinase [Actinomycetota bacterium]|nr:serine/threonine protein kinase [Actinomycetota bacterium]
MSYDVVGLLGRGGSAVVELAIDDAGRRVATKRLALTGSVLQIQVARQRLRREAEILAILAHPGIVPIIEVIDDGSEVVLVFPVLVESLEDRVNRLGPLPPAEVARVGRVLIDALAATHRQGVVHRDIKPSNVLFDGAGQPALADFGVAVTRELTAGLTQAGMVVGTPTWMAPEQARGEAAGPASDVFSLAATLAYAATGEGPYGPGPAAAVMDRAARNQIRPVPPALPSVLRRPLSRMLDHRPERRPSAAGVLGGLHGTIAAPPVKRRWTRPNRCRTRLVRLPLRVLRGPGAPPTVTSRRRQIASLIAASAGVAVVGGVVAVALANHGATPTRVLKAAAPAPLCSSKPYLPCGETVPAPNTDGAVCLPGWYDLDSIAGNGCEAHSDFVTGTALVAGIPLHANLVPASTTDTFTTHVSGHALNLCWGALHITLVAPAQTAERLTVWDGTHQMTSALSADGNAATATIGKPSCFGADPRTFGVTVTPVAGAGPPAVQDFTLTRDGGW